MSVVVNTNVASIKTQNLLNSATTKMNTAMERLSSGFKINSAKDDAAGTVISRKMDVQISGNKVAQDNVQSANAMLSTAEGAYDTIFDNIQRIRDLTLQAKNGTYSENEIQAMQDEVTQRMEEIDRISKSSKYSDLYLFQDQNDSTTNEQTRLARKGATFQVGSNKTDTSAGAENTITIGGKTDAHNIFNKATFSALTGYNDDVSDFDLIALTQAEDPDAYDEAIQHLDDAITEITARKSSIGATQNRLDTALANLQSQYENLSDADSLIKDADMAEEASAYTQQNILQQLTTSMLGTANQAPSIALSLL